MSAETPTGAPVRAEAARLIARVLGWQLAFTLGSIALLVALAPHFLLLSGAVASEVREPADVGEDQDRPRIEALGVGHHRERLVVTAGGREPAGVPVADPRHPGRSAHARSKVAVAAGKSRRK